MIAYNKSDLENNLLSQEAKLLLNTKFITKEKQKNISNQLDAFKTSENWFIRLAFFLLGCLLYSSILGSISFFLMSAFESNYKIIPFIYFIIGSVGAEIITKQTYFRHGLEDAFILGLQISICVAIGINTETFLYSFITMVVIGIVCAIRYIHTISALSSCIGIVLTVFYSVVEYKIIDALYLPFFGLLIAALLFLICKKLSKNSEFYIYKNAIQIVEIFSYLLAYFSLNYLVVRELSQELLHIVVTKNNDIPFAFVFYILTFLIPVLYFYFALKNKDRILFYISILTFVFSIFTIRYYYSILPIEIALTIGGIILFLLSYFTIRFLKNKETGITFQEDRNSEKSIFLNAQALIINSQTSSSQTEIPQSDIEFGGGGFSGGGANGNF
jgi:hypothetical protein